MSFAFVVRHVRVGVLGTFLWANLAGHQSADAALTASSTDATQIMNVVENRDKGDRMTARMQVTITDKAKRERMRVMVARRIRFSGGYKQLIIFDSPADMRNTGFLSVDYDEGSREDDQWLYLPSLHKSTRIASSDKSGSFMGSDFSYSDLANRDPSQYDYKLLEPSVQAGGEDCWYIEARPKTDKERKETGYLKTHVWISKTKLLPLQSKAWVIEGKKLKFFEFGDLRQFDGVWIPQVLTVRTVVGGEVDSTTVIRYVDLRLNQPDVRADDFTQRRLEQGL